MKKRWSKLLLTGSAFFFILTALIFFVILGYIRDGAVTHFEPLRTHTEELPPDWTGVHILVNMSKVEAMEATAYVHFSFLPSVTFVSGLDAYGRTLNRPVQVVLEDKLILFPAGESMNPQDHYFTFYSGNIN